MTTTTSFSFCLDIESSFPRCCFLSFVSPYQQGLYSRANKGTKWCRYSLKMKYKRNEGTDSTRQRPSLCKQFGPESSFDARERVCCSRRCCITARDDYHVVFASSADRSNLNERTNAACIQCEYLVCCLRWGAFHSKNHEQTSLFEGAFELFAY